MFFNKLKANASSVPTTLGGENHGHLSLLLTDITYVMLSLVPFISTPNLSPFAPPAASTITQINTACNIWKG